MLGALLWVLVEMLAGPGAPARAGGARGLRAWCGGEEGGLLWLLRPWREA